MVMRYALQKNFKVSKNRSRHPLTDQRQYCSEAQLTGTMDVYFRFENNVPFESSLGYI